MAPLPHLITIPISHYCERARWALDILAQATGKKTYVEEAHAPPFYKKPVRAAGGKRQVPLLALPPSEDDVVEVSPSSSGAIVAYADARLPPERRLYPEDSDEVVRVGELEKLFDEKLGTAVRTYCYGHLLAPESARAADLLYVCMTDRIESSFERAVTWAAIYSGALVKMIRKGFNLTPESLAEARRTIEELFAAAGELLAKNGGYLVQPGRFTAADLTFAALAAPLFPELKGYAYGISERMGELPKGMVEETARLRATPAGQFVARMYEKHRPPCGAGAGRNVQGWCT
eukprot:tig00000498_g1615.t1